MTSRDFAFWLQGFFEITDTKEVTPEQVAMIKAHLNLVFKHEIDPSILHGLPDIEKQIYAEIHRGKKDGDKIGITDTIALNC